MCMEGLSLNRAGFWESWVHARGPNLAQLPFLTVGKATLTPKSQERNCKLMKIMSAGSGVLRCRGQGSLFLCWHLSSYFFAICWKSIPQSHPSFLCAWCDQDINNLGIVIGRLETNGALAKCSEQAVWYNGKKTQISTENWVSFWTQLLISPITPSVHQHLHLSTGNYSFILHIFQDSYINKTR